MKHISRGDRGCSLAGYLLAAESAVCRFAQTHHQLTNLRVLLFVASLFFAANNLLGSQLSRKASYDVVRRLALASGERRHGPPRMAHLP